MKSITLAILLGLAAALAQNATAPPATFDAASIKPSPPNDPFDVSYDPLRFTSSDQALISLIEAAYGLKSYQVQAPGWMEQERFEISAETQHPATESQMNAMLREFLPRRFGLVTHRSTQSVNVYSLEPANSGSKLEPAPGSDSYVRVGIRYPSGATIQGTGPITELTSITREVDRPVIDATDSTKVPTSTCSSTRRARKIPALQEAADGILRHDAGFFEGPAVGRNFRDCGHDHAKPALRQRFVGNNVPVLGHGCLLRQGCTGLLYCSRNLPRQPLSTHCGR